MCSPATPLHTDTCLASPEPTVLDAFRQSVVHWVGSGGPMPQDYAGFNREIRLLADEVRAGLVKEEAVRRMVKDLTLQCFQGTMQAESVLKPHGYSGDYEIIDHIYQMRIADAPSLRRWDLFFHAQAAPCAVRNRKSYFHQVLRKLAASHTGGPLRILNIASGPARDLKEWLDGHPDSDLQVDCIELDPHAIAYAQKLCQPYADRVQFHHQHALKFVPTQKYHLIWSAGLFDYLTDRLFVRLVRSLLPFLKPGAELVVGNFSDYNPSRDYMELMGDWYLEHRSAERLRSLAVKGGATAGGIEVHWEPEGVNLFLHVRN